MTMTEAELQRQMLYHFYRLHHTGFSSATHAIAATRLFLADQQRIGIKEPRPALRRLEQNLRVFSDGKGLWYCTSGHDGYCGGRSIPRYVATGLTARAAYAALYRALRAGEDVRSGEGDDSGEARVNCMNALWVYMGWTL